MRTKNLEHTLLVLDGILQIYEEYGSLQIRRRDLLKVSNDLYDKKYHWRTNLGHSTFTRCLRDLEEDMAIRIKKIGKENTTIIIDPDRVRRMINDMNSKLGFYRQEKRVTIEDIEPETLEPFFNQLSNTMLENYGHPWLSNIDEQSQDANLIAQRCASKIFAKLISSRFGFTLSTNDINFKSIDKNQLYELGMIASKIASIQLYEPFRLLIDYSGIPESDDWGVITTSELWSILVLDFKVFAKRVFKFELSTYDLKRLINKQPSSMSKPAVRLFDIFRDGYLLPTLRAMKSKNIKFDNSAY